MPGCPPWSQDSNQRIQPYLHLFKHWMPNSKISSKPAILNNKRNLPAWCLTRPLRTWEMTRRSLTLKSMSLEMLSEKYRARTPLTWAQSSLTYRVRRIFWNWHKNCMLSVRGCAQTFRLVLKCLKASILSSRRGHSCLQWRAICKMKERLKETFSLP